MVVSSVCQAGIEDSRLLDDAPFTNLGNLGCQWSSDEWTNRSISCNVDVTIVCSCAQSVLPFPQTI